MHASEDNESEEKSASKDDENGKKEAIERSPYFDMMTQLKHIFRRTGLSEKYNRMADKDAKKMDNMIRELHKSYPLSFRLRYRFCKVKAKILSYLICANLKLRGKLLLPLYIENKVTDLAPTVEQLLSARKPRFLRVHLKKVKFNVYTTFVHPNLNSVLKDLPDLTSLVNLLFNLRKQVRPEQDILNIDYFKPDKKWKAELIKSPYNSESNIIGLRNIAASKITIHRHPDIEKNYYPSLPDFYALKGHVEFIGVLCKQGDYDVLLLLKKAFAKIPRCKINSRTVKIAWLCDESLMYIDKLLLFLFPADD